MAAGETSKSDLSELEEFSQKKQQRAVHLMLGIGGAVLAADGL